MEINIGDVLRCPGRPRGSPQTCYCFGVKLVAALALAIYLPAARGASSAEWTLVRSSHFEVYSQAGERDARSALVWFEQLRAFFLRAAAEQAGWDLNSHGTVRVIGFQSPKKYAAFRLLPAADAYFLGSESADYIVMPRLSSEEFGVAAHEYAHLVFHAMGLRLSPWLAEGISEVFSTVHIGEHGCLIGGDLPLRTQVLRQRQWIPLAQLLAGTANSPTSADRNEANIFYAESWALTDMLIFSPAYAARLSQLLGVMNSGVSGAETVARVYDKPLDAIMADLHEWAPRRKSALPLPGISSVNQGVQVSGLSSFESRLMIAELLLASAELAPAELEYKSLAAERPNDAAIPAALGSIALRKGDRATAREHWKRAMRLGIRDAKLCYQYAVLADDAGVDADEIGRALRLAIALKPDFDDARYELGLLESNRGHYEAALEQLRAMRSVPAGRAYGYWTCLASVLTELDKRKEAKEAASNAMSFATNTDERASASRLALFADTDLTVQLSRDASGNLQMVTARKPHGTSDWNPFIEPADHIIDVEGQIRKVECNTGKITGFRVESASGAVEVTLPDPTHVLIRDGTPEFICDAQDGRKVAIQYAAFPEHGAANGILRGMQFR